jgi:SAM-dependent methyltransferase
MKIHFGCYGNYRKGWVNVDINKDTNPDRVWDMNVFPYPFDSHTADEICCRQTLEHLQNKENSVKAIEEIIRIAKPDAKILITFPLKHMIEMKKKNRLFGFNFDDDTHTSGITLNDINGIPLKKKLYWGHYPYNVAKRYGIFLRPVMFLVNIVLNLNIGKLERFSTGVVLYR